LLIHVNFSFLTADIPTHGNPPIGLVLQTGFFLFIPTHGNPSVRDQKVVLFVFI